MATASTTDCHWNSLSIHHRLRLLRQRCRRMFIQSALSTATVTVAPRLRFLSAVTIVHLFSAPVMDETQHRLVTADGECASYGDLNATELVSYSDPDLVWASSSFSDGLWCTVTLFASLYNHQLFPLGDDPVRHSSAGRTRMAVGPDSFPPVTMGSKITEFGLRHG